MDARKMGIAIAAVLGIGGGAATLMSDGTPQCPLGWTANPVAKDVELHIAQKTCENEHYVVYLTNEGEFSQAFDKLHAVEMITNPTEVEGWLK